MFDTYSEVRRVTGVGLADIKEGMRLWPTDDPWLAAWYMAAKAHAVSIRPASKRDERDRNYAKQAVRNRAFE